MNLRSAVFGTNALHLLIAKGYRQHNALFEPIELSNLKLAYKINFTNPRDAITWEKKIKDWSRKKKEALIDENWNDLILFSKSKTETKIK